MPNNKSAKKRKTLSQNERYPVITEIDGIKIRRINIISLYFPDHAMTKIAKAMKGTTLSIAKVLALSSKPCSCCKGEPVIIQDNGKYISIPRGLMCVSKKTSGTGVKQKKKP